MASATRPAMTRTQYSVMQTPDFSHPCRSWRSRLLRSPRRHAPKPPPPSICAFSRSTISTAICARRRAASGSPIPRTRRRRSPSPPAAPSTWRRWSGNSAKGTSNTIFVAAGDLIGASPFLSAMFHDEPTIESLSMMGLDVSSVGNHEFDEGKDELLRMQNGGCHPIDSCQGPHPFLGREIPLSRRQHDREEHRKDRASRLRDQGIRGHSGGLHRTDAEGHAQHRLAGQRRRPRIPRRGRDGKRAGARIEGARRRGHRGADPRRRPADRRLQ